MVGLCGGHKGTKSGFAPYLELKLDMGFLEKLRNSLSKILGALGSVSAAKGNGNNRWINDESCCLQGSLIPL